MSLTSKATLVSSIILSGVIIGYVHIKQAIDKERLHEGVLRDVERQQRRKIENTYILQQQIELTKQLQQIEGSHNAPDNKQTEANPS